MGPGRELLRAHNGVLFTHHGFSWRKFDGIFSSSALRCVKAKMMALEGLFRKLGPGTARDRESTINRIVALRTPCEGADDASLDAQWFEHLCACATAADPPREGGDAYGDVHGPPWAMQIVKAIVECSIDMQNDLCGKHASTRTWWSGATRQLCDLRARPRTGAGSSMRRTDVCVPSRLVLPITSTSQCRIPLPTL